MLARRGAAVADAELVGGAIDREAERGGRQRGFPAAGGGPRREGGRAAPAAIRPRGAQRNGGGRWLACGAGADDGGPAYDLVFDRAGVFAARPGFRRRRRGRTAIGARWISGCPRASVVPLTLEGLDAGVKFDPGDSVVPGATPQGWRGFLPADGNATLSWKTTRAAAEGTLFFTGSEETDVRVGAGLLRQTSRITLRVLQGKMPAIKLRLDGPGEVLGVEGSNVLGWKVLPGGSSANSRSS